MRKRSCSLVQATLLACGTLGLLTSFATAQQAQKSEPVKPFIAEQKAKATALNPSQTPANGKQTPQGHAPGARPTGNEPAVQLTAPNAGGHAAGGGMVVRGNVLVDSCSDGGIQTLSDGTYAFSIVGYASENGDVDTCAFENTIDGWFLYQPSMDGNANFVTCNIADFDTVFSAFDVCGGTQLGCMDDGCVEPGFRTNWVFPVTAGSTYLIRVSGYNGASGGGQFSVAVAPPPNCYDCQPGAVNENEADCGLSGSDDTNGGCNSLNNPGVATSISVGDNVCGTTGVIANNTRDTDWFQFTLTEDTEVTWNVTAEFPVLVGFINTPCPQGAFIPNTAFVGDACTPVTSTACLAAGTYYAFVACSTFAADITCNGAEGSRYTASLTGIPCELITPPNDDCDGVIALTLDVPELGDNTNGNTSTAVTSCSFGGAPTGPDVFYSFTPTSDDTYLVGTCGSTLDTLISVSTDCPGIDGALLACNDDACGGTLQSEVAVPMTAGTTYFIRVAGWNGAVGPFQVVVTVAPPPPECAECPSGGIAENEADCGLVGDSVNGGCNSTPPVFSSIAVGDTVCGTTGVIANATRDTDWYEFTLAAGTEVTWNVTAEFPVLIGFIASPCPQGAFIPGTAFVSDPCAAVSSTICLPAGTYYAFVACSTFATEIPCTGGPGTRYTATLSGIGCTPFVPPNDDCGTAEALTVDVVAFGDNTNANTTVVVDGTSGCTFGGAPSNNDVWYTFTPASSGTYQFNTCGSALDTTISVWDTCPGDQSFNMLACNDDFCGLQSQVQLDLVANTLYYVRVAGWNNAAGAFQVVVTVPPPPAANDNCPGDIVSAPSVTLGTTIGQSPSGTTTCGADSPDVFYQLTPTVSGVYTIDTCAGATFDTRLSVFTDCPTTSQVACNDDFCGLQSSVSPTLTAGTTYYIRVSAFGTVASGDFTLTISAPPAPPTGACCTGGTCSIATQADCTGGGGTYLGDNSICAISDTYDDGSDLPLFIPDNQCTSGFVGSSQVISDTDTIQNLSVNVQITHTWINDLRIQLTNGTTTVVLWQNICGSNDNINVTFQDGAPAVVCGTPTQGTYAPNQPLSAFTGQSIAGTWTLQVCDSVGADVGNVTAWSITNSGPGNPCGPAFCDADWCQDGSVGVPDIFCFLSDWFAMDPDARNYGGTPGVPAIFAFLSVWFATGQGPCTP